jgi:hypothetical protein
MKRILLTVACLSALLLGACGDSSFPNPTGKGSLRAVNAMPGSPELNFMIEEVLLSRISYQSASAPFDYDDFSYNFSFELRYPEAVVTTVLATTNVQIEKDTEYVFVLVGTEADPRILIWTQPEREWSETETVFEVRFANTRSAGEFDVYFEPVGTPPTSTAPLGTVVVDEILAPRDFEAGDYVITFTTAGDPNDILYQSSETGFTAQSSLVITAFDGNANNTAPIVVRSTSSDGVLRSYADARYPPTIRFIHGARGLVTSDIYDDQALTSLVAAGNAFGEATGDIDTVNAAVIYYYTPAGGTAAVLFEPTAPIPVAGTHMHLYAIGSTDPFASTTLIPDRAGVFSAGKLRLYQASENNRAIDLYAVKSGESIDERNPRVFNVTYSTASPVLELPPDSYDVYLTVSLTKDVLAGPYPIDLAIGDVVDLIALDSADPNIVLINELPVP